MKFLFTCLLLITPVCHGMQHNLFEDQEAGAPLRTRSESYQALEERIARLESSGRCHRIATYTIGFATLIGVGVGLYAQYYIGEKIKSGAHDAMHDAKGWIGDTEQEILDQVTSIAQGVVGNATQQLRHQLAAQISAVSHSFNSTLSTSLHNMTIQITAQINGAVSQILSALKP